MLHTWNTRRDLGGLHAAGSVPEQNTRDARNLPHPDAHRLRELIEGLNTIAL
jgi:hypothetical protein